MDYGNGSCVKVLVVVPWLGGGDGGAACLYLYLSWALAWNQLEPCARSPQAGTRAGQVIGQRKHVNTSLTALGNIRLNRQTSL